LVIKENSTRAEIKHYQASSFDAVIDALLQLTPLGSVLCERKTKFHRPQHLSMSFTILAERKNKGFSLRQKEPFFLRLQDILNIS